MGRNSGVLSLEKYSMVYYLFAESRSYSLFDSALAKVLYSFLPWYGRWSFFHSNPKTVFFFENQKNGGKKYKLYFFFQEKYISHSLENSGAVYQIALYT